MEDLLLYVEVFPWLRYSIAALSGLIAGSFLIFLFYRIKNNEPWLMGAGAARSKCPSCQTTLGARDLIPVISWILSHGKCRHCEAGISWKYPVIEIGTATVFVFIVCFL